MKSMEFNRVEEIINNFKNQNLLVIGDLMIDEFIYASVNRISPEAPVPVAEVIKKEYKLGGASNVANNIASLGGNVFLCGVTGKDGFGRLFKEEAKKLDIKTDFIIDDSDRPTTVKTRIIAHDQQIARIDNEKRDGVNQKIQDSIYNIIEKNINSFDGVIFSDYAKGIMQKDLVKRLIDLFKTHKKKTSVDPKIDDLDLYKGIDYIKPNQKEASLLSKINITNYDSLKKAGELIEKETQCEALIITRGADGISVFSEGREYTVPTVARKVYDVTGAGDTTIAAFMMSVMSGAGIRESTVIANVAAGHVVGEVGTAVVNTEAIKCHLKEIIEEKK